MYRFLKWLVWIAGISFVLTIVAIVAVQIFLSSDEIIRIAEREGQKILGRKVSIDRLELGLFKIEASGIVIDGQTEEGGAKSKTPFVRFDNVEILLNPSALIYKRISILQFTVKGASGHLYRDANGRFNFQDIIDNLNRGTKKTVSSRVINKGLSFSLVREAEAAESTPQGPESGFSFVVHELDLYDVKTELRFDASDVTTAFDGSCSFIHIEVEKIQPGVPLDVFLDGKCRVPDGQQFMQLKGDVNIDMEGPSYRASLEMPLFDATILDVLAPTILGYRFRKGIFTGNLRFELIVGKPLAWDVDLQGRTIHADFNLNPQAKWQNLTLPGLKLKTKGRFNLLDGSARVETFFVDTYFLEVNLTKPALWNVSAKDEVHVEANIRDMREMIEWVSRVTAIPFRGLKENSTAQILMSVKRNREISDDFVRVEMKSRFDPLDLARFVEFIPPVEHVSKIKGNVGGKAHVIFVSGERVQWDLALEARDFGASVRINERERWKTLELGRTVLQSRGNFDMKNQSAQLESLEIELPFATAKLEKPAKWNVHGDDEAEFFVDVHDFSSAADLLERFGLISIEDVSEETKIRFKVALSRNRITSSPLRVDVNARFDSLPVAPLVELVPFPGNVQIATGKVSGILQVSSTPDGDLRWKADIAGKKLGARVKIISKEKPRQVSLGSMGLQSSGFYLASKGSAEIQTLDLKLPFARMFLNRRALWNQRGRDEFSLTLDVVDLDAVEVLLGELMEQPIKARPKNEKLKVTLTGTRDRKDGLGFSYKCSASFDPIRISPWVEFLPISSAIRNWVGEVGGKIEFSYVPGKKMNWNLGLRSEGLRGDILALMNRDWRSVRTGKLRVEAVGSYDFQNQSGRMQSLNLNMPFGHVQISRPADWSMNGMDSGRFQWSLSSLEGATRLAGSILGSPVSEFSVAGTAKGSIEISRNRKKARSISATWSVAANLQSFSHVAYPNLKLAGSISGQGDDDTIKIRIPALKTIDLSKPNTKPDVVLRDLSASMDRSSILRGEIRSPSIRIEKLNVRYVRREKGKTNFDSLFKMAEIAEKRTQRGRSREQTVSTDIKTASRKRRKTGRKSSGPLIPAIKIGKFEVGRMGFHFQDFIAADKPPVVLRVPDARLSITNLDTLMAPDLRETRLEFRTLGESPSLLAKASLNPGSVPPDVDGSFNLSRFDLRKISPYIRDSKGESASALLMRGTKITRGMLDFESTYSLRKSRLNLEGAAQITGLRLKPDEKFPLVDLVVKLLRESVFRLFERPDDTITLNVRVTGRLDDPEFHFLDAIAEPMFLGLFQKAQNLGGNVKDIVTGILGTAIEGVQKIIPTPKGSQKAPEKGSSKESDGGGNQLEQLGKKLEKTLQKGLRGLFGVK